MLKIRRLSEELEAYNPMIPNGRNFKATFMIEYTDPEVRAAQLEILVRIAVHFMRFKVTDEKANALKNGSTWSIGVQHPAYTYEYEIEGSARESLLNDLQ